MHTVKKIFPVLYPLDRNLSKKWFIKYKTECYTTGKLVSKKYYGDLNLLPTEEERLKAANHYIKGMELGEALPDFQGQKNVSHTYTPKNFASLIKCLDDYFKNNTSHLRHSTRLHYKSKKKILYEYLHQHNLQDITIGAFNGSHANSFIGWLKNSKRLTNTTCNDYKRILLTQWKYFTSGGIISANPWQQVKTFRNDSEHFAIYTKEVEQIIIKHLPSFDHQLYIFMQFVYYCSIRPRRELRLLKIQHIDFDNHTITIPASISKSYKARTIVISEHLFKQIAHWQKLPSSYYLFSLMGQPSDKPTGMNYMGYRWQKFREVYGIDNRYKIYGGKHTNNRKMAMIFTAPVIQSHNGHASLSDTQKYIGEITAGDVTFLYKNMPEIGS
jgi:integrase